jgi:hypothetical protein
MGPKNRRQRLIRKRRQTLERLLIAIGVTMFLGIFIRAMFLMNVVLDGALVLYVWQLRKWRSEEVLRARTATRLALVETRPEPARVVAIDEPDRVVRLDDDAFERFAASFR